MHQDAPQDAAQVWDRVSSVLVDQVSSGVWQATFREIRATSLTDHELTLAVPSLVVRDRIETRFKPLLDEAVKDAGFVGLRLSLVVDTTDEPGPGSIDAEDPRTAVPRSPRVVDLTDTAVERRTDEPATAVNAEASSEANPRYTFESFVIGPSNRFAHAAALRVAETPAKAYNPLFVYGDAGLGKTHLLQAVANYVAENYPTYRIRYISTETMLNEFVASLRDQNQPSFKRRYRDIDVLLVDDIQFIEGKDQLQEEFFHTFNTLYESQRQIVLSSDRPPDAIATLEDRLRSRFKMGLITDIQPPGFETRLAILQKKAEQSHMSVPDDVLGFIAANITYNIRELEGALTRVSAYANLNNERLSEDLARQVLRDTITASGPRQITVDLILERTSEFFGKSLHDLKGSSRTRDLVHARQIAMYVCRELTDLSYPQIAAAFGGRDHTTVIHAVNKITKQIAERPKTYDDVTALTQRIRNGT